MLSTVKEGVLNVYHSRVFFVLSSDKDFLVQQEIFPKD